MEERLREIIISVTNRCNLRCMMCKIPLQSSEEMTTDELKLLIDDAVNLNPNSIVFSGGEPLLRKDILELIAYANHKKINTCLTSNGTLIDDAAAKELACAGIGVINISIEGPEDIHDQLRGKGAFKKSVAALKSLAKNKIETTIATVVCGKNYKALPYVMELAHQFGVTTVKFQPFSEIFLGGENGKKGFFAPPHALKEIKKTIDETIKISREYKISTNPASYLEVIPLYLCGLWEGDYRKGCSALKQSCPVSPEGNVYLCWTLSNRPLGNVKKEKLSQIWSSPAHNLQRTVIQNSGCPGCLMSCYDYNLGQEQLAHKAYYKLNSLSKASFYKRQYYRIRQNILYISKKVLNRVRCLKTADYHCNNPIGVDEKLKEISAAKDILKRKLKHLEK